MLPQMLRCPASPGRRSLGTSLFIKAFTAQRHRHENDQTSTRNSHLASRVALTANRPTRIPLPLDLPLLRAPALGQGLDLGGGRRRKRGIRVFFLMTQIPARCICYLQQSCGHGSWRCLNHHRQEEEGPEAPTWQAQATTASYLKQPQWPPHELSLQPCPFHSYLYCLPPLRPSLSVPRP